MITNIEQLKRIYFEDDAGGGFGGGDGGSGEGDGAPAPVSAPATVGLSEDSLKALGEQFGQQLGNHLKAQQPAGPVTYTPEQQAEARKNLNFWEPNDEFLQKFGNLETQKDAFVLFRDGLTNQMVTIMKALVDQQSKSYDEKLAPVQSLLTQRQEAEREDRFFKSNPTLKDPKFQDIIRTVGGKLHEAGQLKGKSEAETFALIASGVESVIKQFNPEFQLGAEGGNAPASSSRNSNAIPPTSSGAGGGAGAGANVKASNLPIAAQILGPVKPRR